MVQVKVISTLNLIFWLCVLQQEILAQLLPQPRIINGQEVKWNSTRYQVSIRIEDYDRYFFGIGHLCGGSIITRNAILTSAHCIWDSYSNSFYPANKFSVVMGNLDRSLKNENSLKFGVSKIITEPNFSSITFQNDLAIMFLNQSIPENFTRMEVIEINDNLNIKEGVNCIVSGWGLTEKKTFTRNLMYVEVPLINKSICSLNYGSETILDGMLCAGYMAGERDACKGDSGGPLVCQNKLVGIVSFGLGCAMSGYPGVYTNVAYYYNWIRRQLGLGERIIELSTNSNDYNVAPSNSPSIVACSKLIFTLLMFVNVIKKLVLL